VNLAEGGHRRVAVEDDLAGNGCDTGGTPRPRCKRRETVTHLGAPDDVASSRRERRREIVGGRSG
jgi:hypothetical protein